MTVTPTVSTASATYAFAVSLLAISLLSSGVSVMADPPQSADGQESTDATSEQQDSAQPEAMPTRQATWPGLPNIKAPTLGGKQLWTDHVWRAGWRIQQNSLTGHWRLLDDRNVRHAWGSRVACESALMDQQLPQPSGDMVILLHGLMRSATSMSKLAEYITEQMGRTVVLFEYASTRATIADHAAALREVIAHLPEDAQFSLVGHSMGNIVVRHALGDWQREGDQATLDRIQQVVMLGPPNQGASIARQLAKTGVFGWITGKGGMELGPEWQNFEAKLAIPECPFGIVAGRLPETVMQNPLVDGDSDFVVSVEETQLAGASDVLIVPRLHSFLMDDETVQKAVVNFLNHRSFGE